MKHHHSTFGTMAQRLAGLLGLLSLLGTSPLVQAQMDPGTQTTTSTQTAPRPSGTLAATNVITRTSSFEYDAQGLLVREVVEPDSPQDCLSSTYGYDNYGNKTSVITAACAGATGTILDSASTARTANVEFAAHQGRDRQAWCGSNSARHRLLC